MVVNMDTYIMSTYVINLLHNFQTSVEKIIEFKILAYQMVIKTTKKKASITILSKMYLILQMFHKSIW